MTACSRAATGSPVVRYRLPEQQVQDNGVCLWVAEVWQL